MKLNELLVYQEIVIQCHDNPDADAIASGYALYKYFAKHNKKVTFIYGGRNIIRKSNLVMMVNELKIPIKHAKALKTPDLLVTVDCQYGSGNVTKFKAKNVAVIDHHRTVGELPEASEVRSYLGACATLVWQMLIEAGEDVNEDRSVATALYYGLFSDTNGFTEISHPLDKDLRDEADFDPSLMTKLRNANMSLEELEIAATALLRSDYVEEQRFAIVKAGPCDPNVLGIISDLVLGVDAIDICIVFNVMPNGAKISVRSCVKEVKANELAEAICTGIGSGGGHFGKAGGFIPMDLLVPEYEAYCKREKLPTRMRYNEDGSIKLPTDSAVKTFIEARVMDYFDNTEFIYDGSSTIDVSDMKSYLSRPLPEGYVDASDLAEVGTLLTVRTMAGDIDTEVTEDLIFVIDDSGKVKINSDMRFYEAYREYKDWRFRIKDTEYRPTIKNNFTGDVIDLQERISVCVPKDTRTVLARPLTSKVKVFSRWNDSLYVSGGPGDMLIAQGSVPYDVTTMKKNDFDRMFKPEESNESLNEYKAVIFDLDGTLLDTLDDLRNAVNAALEAYGLPSRSLEEIRKFVGNGIKKLVIRAVPEGEDNPNFDGIFDKFKEYYALHCKDNTAPYKDIMFLLEELKTRKIKMAIVSNKVDSAVKELADEYFPAFMEAAIGECEGIRRKPDPDTAIEALRILGVKPTEAVYVGDSDVDILTAQNAGMSCISVTWGFRDAEFLKANGAECLIDNPLEILSII